jgi:O-acetylhomoserine (thiol)-lyase
MKNKGFTTTNLHSDRLDEPEHGVLHKPIHPSVAYQHADSRHLAEVFQGKRPGYNYGRQLNPTVTALQTRINKMETGLATVAFATGMAAIGSSLISLLKAGDHIISSAFLFGNTNSLFGSLTRLGIEVSFVDATDAKNVTEAIQENTRLVFVETIANPLTQVADLSSIGDLCEQHNLIYCVDNTMTSPYLFLPKSVKANLIVNSLTKYIGGHGNALGGAVTDTGLYDWTDYPNIYDAYKNGDPHLWGINQIRKKGLRDFGASLGPEAAHHLAVGSETLPLRMKKSCSNALILARFCNDHPKIKQVYYPGLECHPQFERAHDLFKLPGAIFSLELDENLNCFDFLNRLNCVVSSSNLGDVRTLAIPVAHTIYFEMGPERRASMGIADSLIRFSVGIEDTEDLIDDFTQALS